MTHHLGKALVNGLSNKASVFGRLIAQRTALGNIKIIMDLSWAIVNGGRGRTSHGLPKRRVTKLVKEVAAMLPKCATGNVASNQP